jgi:hypothetical protein
MGRQACGSRWRGRREATAAPTAPDVSPAMNVRGMGAIGWRHGNAGDDDDGPHGGAAPSGRPPSSDRLGPDVIGRWACGLSRGRWRLRHRASPRRAGSRWASSHRHEDASDACVPAAVAPPEARAKPAQGDGVRIASAALLSSYSLAGLRLARSPTGDAARIDGCAPQPHCIRHRDRAVDAASRTSASMKLPDPVSAAGLVVCGRLPRHRLPFLGPAWVARLG